MTFAETDALQILNQMSGADGLPVDELAWRKRCREFGMVSESNDPRMRQQAVRRAVDGLIRAGRVTLVDRKATPTHGQPLPKPIRLGPTTKADALVDRWLDECCEFDHGVYALRGNVIDAWLRWVRDRISDRDYAFRAEKILFARFRARGIQALPKTGGVILGFRLKPKAPTIDPDVEDFIGNGPVT